jgi:hypothetical protein
MAAQILLPSSAQTLAKSSKSNLKLKEKGKERRGKEKRGEGEVLL